MKRSPSKSWRHPKELLVPRLSNFAKFSGVTTQRKRQLGNEKKNFEKTTRSYLLANPNLEGEIHLKGVRLVTSQILGKNLKILHMKSYHHFMHSFIFAMHNFNLRYYVLLIKSFSVCSDSRGNLLFHKFKIVLNHFGAF
jgi:hypothetical protein